MKDSEKKELLDLPIDPDQLRNRSGSTYLNFNNALSRRCSTTSQHFSMNELEEKSKLELDKLIKENQAPLAKPESLHSLAAIKDDPIVQNVIDEFPQYDVTTEYTELAGFFDKAALKFA